MNDISEMTWIEEHFYDQALSKGLTIGENRGRLKGRSETLNAAVDFMRSHGISSERIDNFGSYFRNSDSEISLRLNQQDDMSEINWIGEHFYNQAIRQGIRVGENRGRLQGRAETLHAAIDFMRSNGMSIDKVNDFKKSVLNN